MARTGKIGWNRDKLKGLSRAKFVEMFRDVYPDVDLKAEHARMFPPKSRNRKQP